MTAVIPADLIRAQIKAQQAAGAQGDFVAKVNAFVDELLIPIEKSFLQGSFKALKPELDRVRQEAKKRGLWAPWIPKAHGGLGLTLPEYAKVSAALGRSPLGHYALNCQAPDVGNMELLMSHGSEEQRARWLAPLVAGSIRSCFSMTEPEFAGSNPVWMETRAVRDCADYVITGHKWFTSAADGASFAIVMAVTNPDAKPHERASQIIVPMDAPGVTLVRNIPIMGDVGDDYASHGEMRYEKVRVPITNRLGAEGAGFALAQERLGPGRIHHCMRWIGICDRAIDLMCRHAASRMIAPGVPLGSKQAVQHMIAECRAETDAARLFVLDAAQQIEAKGAHEAAQGVWGEGGVGRSGSPCLGASWSSPQRHGGTEECERGLGARGGRRGPGRAGGGRSRAQRSSHASGGDDPRGGAGDGRIGRRRGCLRKRDDG
ncbi:MAG: acyl-CoA dehydrogenase family protein [Gemmatimonadetes bacterium]|nr:acyl-CoA dehydrogenase family protein [Gemmatimonadota bacterium]